MSDEHMKVRVVVHGPKFWQSEVLNVETGQRLPVLLDPPPVITIENGTWVAKISLQVHEVDATVSASVDEQVESVSEAGAAYIATWDQAAIVRRPAPEAPAETVDDFAAATVSLITRPG